ncbi:hypothetical protein [uncultured Lacinutrix sp.]|uniref:hypothetical protein n=1 Tax=uncultured Lacinutrix sp. TaxID=574032 RepID=UPI002612ACD6|nr:hypothetical protein [uncultured Lacinutrix sp.]
MKNVLKFSLVILMIFGFFSCDDEEVVIDEQQQTAAISPSLKTSLSNFTETASTTNQDSDFFNNNDDCFELAYPLSVTSDGGITVTVINNEEELYTYLSTMNPNGPSGNFDYVYPLNATVDGEMVTFNNAMEVQDAILSCIEDQYPDNGNPDNGNPTGNGCFEFNFPLQVETVDGQTVTINNMDELITVNGVGFAYPITVTLNDGTVATINSDDEFDALYNDCYDIDTCDNCEPNCFIIVYPINLISDSGVVTTINNDDEFAAFFENINENDLFTVTYPLNLEYEDGTQVTVNNDAEFEAEFANCM